MLATWWLSMGRTNCRMEPRSILVPRAVRMARAAVPHLHLPLQARRKRGVPRRAALEDLRDESVTAVHSAAGRHHPFNGRRPSRGLGRFPAIAHLSLATSRLPNNPSANVLSWRQPGGHGLFGNVSSRAPIRTNFRLVSDDLHEFLRELDDHAAIQFGPEYRRR